MSSPDGGLGRLSARAAWLPRFRSIHPSGACARYCEVVLLKLLLALLGLQLLDLVLLVVSSRSIGFWPTVVVLIGMGLVGSTLARREGRRVWSNFQSSLAEGRPPEQGVIDGMLVLLGGVLMLLPGILTDVIGLLLVVPPLRRWLAERLRQRVSLELTRAAGRVPLEVRRARGLPDEPSPPAGSPRVIETTGVESRE